MVVIANKYFAAFLVTAIFIGCSFAGSPNESPPIQKDQAWLEDLATCLPGTELDPCLSKLKARGFKTSKSEPWTVDGGGRVYLPKDGKYVEFVVFAKDDWRIKEVIFAIDYKRGKERKDLVGWIENQTKTAVSATPYGVCGCDFTGPAWAEVKGKGAEVSVAIDECTNADLDSTKKRDFKKYFINRVGGATVVCFAYQESKSGTNDGKWVGQFMQDFVNSKQFTRIMPAKNPGP